jgi:hypothetical protein
MYSCHVTILWELKVTAVVDAGTVSYSVTDQYKSLLSEHVPLSFISVTPLYERPVSPLLSDF